jgi:hypothetical protein
MRFWARKTSAFPVESGCPRAQFPFQVSPFKEELAARLDKLPDESRFGDLGEIKTVPAPARFLREDGEIGRDYLHRLRLRLKTRELRMTGVPTRLAAQNILRQQSLAPRRD